MHVFQVEEVPVVPEPPVEEEAPEAVQTKDAKGAKVQPGDEEKKMEDKVKKVDGDKKDKKGAEKGKEGEGEVKEETLEPVGEDPTRWHDTSLWIIDQNQERFRQKVFHLVFPPSNITCS
jgi:hypothetical protein